MASPILVKKRPAAVLVLAILHLVGGGIDLVRQLCAGAMLAAGSTNPFGGMRGGAGQDPGVHLQKAIEAIPGQQAFTVGELAINLVLDVLLIAAGIGLLSVKPWARILSMVYAPLAILNRLGAFAYELLVLIPAVDTLLRQELGRAPGVGPELQAFNSFMKAGMIVSSVIGLLFVIYPIVVLILLNLSHVRAAFSGKSDVLRPALPEDEGWGPIQRPGLSTDVTTERERDRFQPPE
jgi:hypothetical protein